SIFQTGTVFFSKTAEKYRLYCFHFLTDDRNNRVFGQTLYTLLDDDFYSSHQELLKEYSLQEILENGIMSLTK
ncbi:MAG: hypothetical protein LBR26_11530, partial [Prevotella sp.]|nr:hypothetical protein [Prevotella sp.]